jgi:hypothetical protein
LRLRACTQIEEAIEALDPGRKCSEYWEGKEERSAAAAGLPVPHRVKAPRPARTAGGSARRSRRRHDDDSDEEQPAGEEGEEDETAYLTNRRGRWGPPAATAFLEHIKKQSL